MIEMVVVMVLETAMGVEMVLENGTVAPMGSVMSMAVVKDRLRT